MQRQMSHSSHMKNAVSGIFDAYSPPPVAMISACLRCSRKRVA